MRYQNALFLMDMPSLKNPSFCEKFSGENVLISCLEDKNLPAKFYKCEIASLSFVLALLCKMSDADAFGDLDEGYLSAESCLGEEEAAEILSFLQTAKYLVVDENLNATKDGENIKYFLNFLSQKFQLEILNSGGERCDFKNSKRAALKELDNYDGLVLFKVPLQDGYLHCSRQFLSLARCQDKSEVEVEAGGFKFRALLKLDEALQGTIALLDNEKLGFDFTQIRIKEAK
ncbi:hypothetical protein [Campylobacter sp.]|uniref:hypothetical protein n=1 Tax=Campylobacter sp. TaxID=205 RepID=UPI0026DAB5EB|nr:hypothetical protein [Campylobacter sp.]MDO4673567.1 hypothetical protein [Campylobacter sp.]